jgi:hypothetical protein
VKQYVASFGELNIRERTDLQRLLRQHPESLAEELMTVLRDLRARVRGRCRPPGRAVLGSAPA